jgi:catechol-2,3-dioxygenase
VRSSGAPCSAWLTRASRSTTRLIGATVSVYLEDPDGNGIELYYDRPRSVWFDDDGTPILRADRFDYDASDRSTSPNGAIEAHPDHHLRQAGRALTVELNRASSARAKPSDR